VWMCVCGCRVFDKACGLLVLVGVCVKRCEYTESQVFLMCWFMNVDWEFDSCGTKSERDYMMKAKKWAKGLPMINWNHIIDVYISVTKRRNCRAAQRELANVNRLAAHSGPNHTNN